MQPTSNLATPEILGPFRLIQRLGDGGNSVVFLAERTDPAQRVAIKLFHEGTVINGASSNEERSIAGLDHPHIVRVIDHATTDEGRHYLVMEFVDGLPIDEYCDTHRLTVPARIHLLLQVLDAVQYAHQRHVIHGDLKPTNILITAEGNARLIDFGAKASTLTADFTSPEQQTGNLITLSTDIYSLGLIARLLLAGAEPSAYFGEPASEYLDRHPQAETYAWARSTSWTTLVATLRGDLDAILKKSLYQGVNRRYPSVELFSSDLRNYLAHRPVSVRPLSPMERVYKWVRRHKLLATVTTTVLAVVLLVVVGLLLRSARMSHERTIAEARLHDLAHLTGTLDNAAVDSSRPEDAPPPTAAARASLLVTVTQALNRLSEADGKDPVLALQLSDQYEKLARLQLEETAPSAHDEAAQDVARGIALLRGIPASSKFYSASQTRLDSLIALQKSMH